MLYVWVPAFAGMTRFFSSEVVLAPVAQGVGKTFCTYGALSPDSPARGERGIGVLHQWRKSARGVPSPLVGYGIHTSFRFENSTLDQALSYPHLGQRQESPDRSHPQNSCAFHCAQNAPGEMCEYRSLVGEGKHSSPRYPSGMGEGSLGLQMLTRISISRARPPWWFARRFSGTPSRRRGGACRDRGPSSRR